MSRLIDEVIDTYGGVARWNDVTTIRAHKRFGGAIWYLKQVAGIVEDGDVTVWAQEQRTSLRPFTADDRASAYTPQRVAITATDGATVDELDHPRASFAGHDLHTPWSALQLAYFTGYAMWTYLTEPLHLTLPGVTLTEGAPWVEEDQTWRRLHVDYPPHIATHSPSQVLYVDQQGLVRRRDYQVDIAGGSPAAHYVSDFRCVDSIVVPTTRMIYVRDESGHPLRDQLVVSIELTGIEIG